MGQACVKKGLDVKYMTSSNHPEGTGAGGPAMSARGPAKSMDFTNINGQQLLLGKTQEGSTIFNFRNPLNNDYLSNFKAP